MDSEKQFLGKDAMTFSGMSTVDMTVLLHLKAEEVKISDIILCFGTTECFQKVPV